MSLLKKNILANFAGSAWQTLMGFIFIPLYIKFIGIESWGLVGIFATLLATFGLLDMGLSSTLTRELARLSPLTQKKQEMCDLVRTLEIIYWSIAILIGITIILLNPLLTNHWIKPEHLSIKTVKQALLIIGLVVSFQMPITFYSGGLIGLQKQALFNTIKIFISTLRNAGAILILWLVSPTLKTYFLWHLIISIIHTIILATFLWKVLPTGERKASFKKQLLKKIWKFAAGVSGITILAVILTQLDKIILSKMLPLKIFGYYTLASMIAMILSRITAPIFQSIYPRFTQLISIGDEQRLTRLYHEVSQFIAVLIFPITIVITFFSYEILLFWTKDPSIAEKTHRLVSILICGTAINGIMNIPYALQLASGWTKLSVLKNVIAVILFIPIVIYSIKKYGAVGASFVWLTLNICYFFFEVPIMHCRLLSKEKWRWYFYDVSLPLISCILAVGIGKLLTNTLTTGWMILLRLSIITIFTFLLTALITPFTRNWAINILLNKKRAIL